MSLELRLKLQKEQRKKEGRGQASQGGETQSVGLKGWLLRGT